MCTHVAFSQLQVCLPGPRSDAAVWIMHDKQPHAKRTIRLIIHMFSTEACQGQQLCFGNVRGGHVLFNGMLMSAFAYGRKGMTVVPGSLMVPDAALTEPTDACNGSPPRYAEESTKPIKPCCDTVTPARELFVLLGPMSMPGRGVPGVADCMSSARLGCKSERCGQDCSLACG